MVRYVALSIEQRYSCAVQTDVRRVLFSSLSSVHSMVYQYTYNKIGRDF